MPEEKEPKNILILKASKDICGNEIGLIENHCQLLEMNVYPETISNEAELEKVVEKYAKTEVCFDYIYLCTHGSPKDFLVDIGDDEFDISWSRFAELMCENAILNDDSFFLLACCKGGFFQVATDMMACCHKINFVCGVKWTVAPWDLTTGFVVFIHSLETKLSEPSYAAKKASLATDYTFVAYDRDEIEMSPQYENRKKVLFEELGWANTDGEIITEDEKILANIGVSE